ncbi:DUF2306 domain-containing protein [Thalassobellus suaedae]|uniref:DUF2306 domain-containing protein n=1 Tax=Thalassobellus suaedae TaxID=3074124 RepID=A0ABY9XU54_9FLAO|nr:DUF2306 domain-containing protein [Flavobacteriaceae bacterium HL-DH14]
MTEKRLSTKQKYQHILLIIVRTLIPVFAILFVTRFIYKYLNNKFPSDYGTEFWDNHIWFILHITGGSLVIILGSLQFSAFLRRKFMPYHRIAGKIYIWSSIISIFTLYIILQKCTNCEPGWTSKFFVGTLWLIFTLSAWWTVLHKNIKSHRQFMTRSFVCASYFVIVRILDTVGDTNILPFIKDPIVRYVDGDWLSWLVPLFIVEFYQSWW